MNIYFNGESFQINNQNSLVEILAIKKLSEKKGIAVAVNNKVVPKQKWNDFIMNENDKILVITATQGG